ncbi:hypothetical protein PAECIP111893_05264 [Paenibacillus plantiphilus]|uniref:Helix-turn-helix domain-containing protein n=1 Tax=Paenibacillus plantiphilus TaxID=2905650 RepID=A0ABN8H6X7_9BACL|nr:helix-turn-helix domain-containing protein [Paenibacillus plantiphilus]CAH1225495.1 hypothetical protein PAECIP111893_05264 [Paenibacillus plantiphilus]
MKNNSLSAIIASSILGICFIIGCLILVSDRQEETEIPPLNPLLSLQEAADYLGLNEEQVKNIISVELASGSFSEVKFPYIRLNNNIYISRDGLANWIHEAVTNKLELGR